MIPVSNWLNILADMRRQMEQLLRELQSEPSRSKERQSALTTLMELVQSMRDLEDRLTDFSAVNPAHWDQVDAAPINQRLAGFRPASDERDWDQLLLRVSEQMERVRNAFHALSKGDGRDDWLSARQRLFQMENRLEALTNRLHGTVYASFLSLQENVEFDDRGERIVIHGPGDDWPDGLTTEQGQFD